MEKLLKDYEQYLSSGVHGLQAESSVRRYMYEARHFLQTSNKRPEEFAPEDIDAFMSPDGRRYKPSTKQGKLAALRKFFEYLVSRKFIQENPCAGALSPRIPYIERVALTQDQVQHFFEVISRDTTLPGKMYLAMVALLYYLGLRASEVALLELSHVTAGAPIWLTVHLKGGKFKIYPILNPQLQTYFLPWWNFRKSFGGPKPALFINLKKKTPLSVRTLERRVHSFGKMANLPIRIHPHLLRRCFATHLKQKGVDIFTICRLMGHARIDVTKRYVTDMDEEQQAALLLLR